MSGTVSWLVTMGSVTVAFLFTSTKHRLGDALLGELADMTSVSFGFGAAIGALFALLLIVAERRHTLATISDQRFRLWGTIAGAVPVAVFEATMHATGNRAGLMWAGYAVFAGAFAGRSAAEGMLWMARRANTKPEVV